MSGRFISGGTMGSSGEVSKDDAGEAAQQHAREPLAKKNAEWEAVQQELEAERKRREQQRVNAATGGGEQQSLYDVLQANKAAKQAAFEEQARLKNQFRALDDDEVEFLDEVRAKKRAEEERVRNETEEGLKAFRERQKSGGGGGDEPAKASQSQDDDGGGEPGEEWAVGGRKRKRAKEREALGVKRKAPESGATDPRGEDAVRKREGDGDGDGDGDGGVVEKQRVPAAQQGKRPSLVAYDSDDD